MQFPRPDGWQGGSTDTKIVSGQRGFHVPDRHDDGDEDFAEQTADEFDYRNMGSGA